MANHFNYILKGQFLMTLQSQIDQEHISFSIMNIHFQIEESHEILNVKIALSRKVDSMLSESWTFQLEPIVLFDYVHEPIFFTAYEKPSHVSNQVILFSLRVKGVFLFLIQWKYLSDWLLIEGYSLLQKS